MSTKPPPSSKKSPPPPEEQMPLAIIIPKNVSQEDQEAIARSLYKDHGEYIVRELIRLGDIQEASAQDIRQRVIVLVRNRLVQEAAAGEEESPPELVRAFVREVALNEGRNWKRARRRKPDMLRAGEGDADDAPASVMDPQQALEVAEHKAKVRRYIHTLPAGEAAVVRVIDLDEMTLDQAAEKLDMSRSAVHRSHARAMKQLRAMWRADEQGTKQSGGAGGAAGR